jgi:hypothetical protein
LIAAPFLCTKIAIFSHYFGELFGVWRYLGANYFAAERCRRLFQIGLKIERQLPTRLIGKEKGYVG